MRLSPAVRPCPSGAETGCRVPELSPVSSIILECSSEFVQNLASHENFHARCSEPLMTRILAVSHGEPGRAQDIAAGLFAHAKAGSTCLNFCTETNAHWMPWACDVIISRLNTTRIFAVSPEVCLWKIGVLHVSCFLVQRSWPRSRNQVPVAFACWFACVRRSCGTTRPHTAAITTLLVCILIECSATLAVLDPCFGTKVKNINSKCSLCSGLL